MREGCSVALMGLLLDTIPDWKLSLRVVFTIFALCMTDLSEAAERLQCILPSKLKLHARSRCAAEAAPPSIEQCAGLAQHDQM